MTQQLFDEVVGTPPPSTVDVPGIVRREGRRRSMLQIGAGVAAVAALTVSAGVLRAVQSEPNGAPTRQAATDTRFRLVADSGESAQATAARLRQALDEALKREAPTAAWISAGGATPESQLPTVLPVKEQDKMFFGATGVRVGDRKGTLSLNILDFSGNGHCENSSDSKCHAENAMRENAARQRAEQRERMLGCGGEANCAESVGPHGEKVIALTSTAVVRRSTSPWPFAVNEVRVGLVDGRILILQSDNEFGTGSDGSATASAGAVDLKDTVRLSFAQRDPSLDLDQTTAMAQYVSGQIKA